MSGPYHDFYLLKRSEAGYGDYLDAAREVGRVSLPDDLVTYIWDTINWVPCLNLPFGKKPEFPSQGLNYYGPTIVEKEGAAIFRSILGAWISIFSVAPKVMVLKGNWRWRANESSIDGAYRMLEFELDEVCALLNRLDNLLEQVEVEDSDYYIVHVGV